MTAAMHTEKIRHPAVAGSFYPADPDVLRANVEGYLAAAAAHRSCGRSRPKALIVPHAGYVYSGPIAASAYVCLGDLDPLPQRVILMGPTHRTALRGLATTACSCFETPLGRVPIDREAVATLRDLPQVLVNDKAHAGEHSLEVQLPFLQCVLGEFRLVPFAVGEAAADEVAEVMERLWGGPETVLVISSDLSHYHDYAVARRLDTGTTRAIEGLSPERLGAESACGRVPVRGLLVAARHHGLRVKTVDLRNSGDTAGSHDAVVGYGAYVFEPA